MSIVKLKMNYLHHLYVKQDEHLEKENSLWNGDLHVYGDNISKVCSLNVR